MLTFSRASATEFKQRLIELIGNAAHFVEIKTFHSYCFDLLGRIGNLEDVKMCVSAATEMIENGEVEPNRIGKSVLVIDEAQDMSDDEYSFVRALMKVNEEMRVIAVGDDDQNIYEFRGSNSKYMHQLSNENGSRFIEMTENYRSSKRVVSFANEFAKNITRRMKTSSIISMKNSDGWVSVTYHLSTYMYQPIVDNLIKNRGLGSSCILTQTNEEAVIMVALLRKYGIKSTLIQSMDGFRFSNLAEIKYLLKYLSKNLKTPLIVDKIWEEAKSATYKLYNTSTSISYVKNCIELFEQTNKTKYFSDFKEFVFESSAEDFCDISGEDVVVSTIHKAKGKEFDDVYMLVSDNYSKDDTLFRRYYVGMTRAKNRLFIHTNSDCFSNKNTSQYIVDQKIYSMPEEVVLQLSHKDVYLGFFKNIKKEILSLRSGQIVNYSNKMFYVPTNNMPIAKLSVSMQETLNEWKNKGYDVKYAYVRFIVAWKPKDEPKDEPETAVVLFDIVLSSL